MNKTWKANSMRLGFYEENKSSLNCVLVKVNLFLVDMLSIREQILVLIKFQ